MRWGESELLTRDMKPDERNIGPDLDGTCSHDEAGDLPGRGKALSLR